MKITYITEEPNLRLILRVTKKSFPKNITIDQFISYIRKSIKYKGNIQYYTEQRRYSIYLDRMEESKVNRLVKKIQKYADKSKYGNLIREIRII